MDDRRFAWVGGRSLVVGVCAGLMLSSFIHSVFDTRGVWRRIAAADFRFNPPLLHAPETHEELDALTATTTPVEFKDALYHKDDVSVAAALASRVRVLCWVMTSAANLDKKAAHVRDTWAKRCNRVLFVSDYENATFPTVNISVPHGRDHLTMKTMLAFDYIYKNHRDEADWFLKTDDDTYVIVENLRHLLSPHKPSEPIYFGHHFKMAVKQGYFSGGSGYVLSSEALRRFAGRNRTLCREDGGSEDVEMGRCMQALDVRPGESRDALNRTRFHVFAPERHIHGDMGKWFHTYSKYKQLKGRVSDYPVTFHYIPPMRMYELEYYFYHAKVYGIISGIVDVNVAPSVNVTDRLRTNTTLPRVV